MSEVAIRVENLSKRYRIGKEIVPARTAVGRLGQALASPFRWLVTQVTRATEAEILWALRDVSFELKRGEVLGVIGRNGAGKSTLLKILSRITEPTSGFAEIHGRVGSLLEVGTGMHPELTGRENIYMNGTILGMRKAEIDRKLDAIVAFSGIPKFLDTPVKRYSSGMRVRLGFAIAAHLEPEILIVDEVLAVGDVEFQRQCLGKMKDVAGHGRTVLFVSHNMGAITDLCTTAIVLEHGRLTASGAPGEMVNHYITRHSKENAAEFDATGERREKPAWLKAVRSLGPDGELKSLFGAGEEIRLSIDLVVNRPAPYAFAAIVHDLYGRKILSFVSLDEDCVFRPEGPGEHNIEVRFRNILNNGRYVTSFQIADTAMRVVDLQRDCLEFTSDCSADGRIRNTGLVLQPADWRLPSAVSSGSDSSRG